MIQDEIMALEAGREMDALIAEHAMKWHKEHRNNLDCLLYPGFDRADDQVWVFAWWVKRGSVHVVRGTLPYYSVNITDAWHVHLFMLSQEPRIKALYLHALADVLTDRYSGPPSVWTAPLECFDEDTICRAALLATMEAKT